MICRQELIFANAGIRSDFLAGAFKSFEVGVEFVHFVRFIIGGHGFLPFPLRALPKLRGAIGLAHLGVNVAEMAKNGGVVAVMFDGLAQRLFGLAQLILFVVSPAETIEVRTAVGILGHGFLNHRSGLGQAHAAIGQHVTVIVQGRGAVGVEVQNFTEFLLGQVEFLLALVDRAPQEPGGLFAIAVRRQFLGLGRGFLGVVVFLAAFLGLGDIQINFLVAVVSTKEGAEQLGGGVGVGFFGVEHGQGDRHIRVAGCGIEQLFGFGNRSIEIAILAVGVDQQHLRALLGFGAELGHVLIGADRGGIILFFAVGVAQLLVENRESIGIVIHVDGAGGGLTGSVGAGRLVLHAGNCVGKNFYGVFVATLIFVKQGFVVEDFQAAGRELFGAEQARFGLIEFTQAAIKLGHAQIIFGGAGLDFGKLLELLERLGVFILFHQGLGESVQVRRIVGIFIRGFAIGLFRLGIILGLGVGVAEQVIHFGRR